MSAEKVLQIAANEVGYLEKKSNAGLSDKTANAGNANYTKYGAWYAGGSFQAQPWCDIFVSWCADQAGEMDAVGCFAYVPSHVNFFKNKGSYFARGVKTPQPGDVIFFQNESHVGYVEYVSGGYVHTIEGNTSGGSTLVANGGGVFRKSYALTSSYILGYGRPAYSTATTPSYKAGWKQDSIGWWYVHSDGSYNRSAWEQIDGEWYYFDETGYMVHDTAVEYDGKIYTFDGDGHVTVTTKPAEEGNEVRYEKLGEVTNKFYRPTLDKLIQKGYLTGKGGTGEDMVIDLSEDAVRVLVILDRAGMFDR